MTNPGSGSISFGNSLLDRLEAFPEAEQDAPGVDPWDKDSDYIWKPPRQDRNGGGDGFPEDRELPG